MTLHVASKRRGAASLRREFGDARLLDVTSRGDEPWLRFSPFYPHGDIPVPLSPGVTSETVEGIWQALKVFEAADVDPSKLEITTMKGIKRTVRSNGAVLGHRQGLAGDRLLSYVEARRQIYLPSYRWVLERKLRDLTARLREMAAARDVVLLDYTTNGDVDDVSRPLSHAALVRSFEEGKWPA
jgi:hypothetical protein